MRRELLIMFLLTREERISILESNNGESYLNLVIMGIAVLILIVMVQKYRSDLRIWLWAFIIQFLAILVAVILNDTSTTLALIVSGIGLLVILMTVIKQYRETFSNKNNAEKITGSVVASFFMIFQIEISFSAIIVSLVILILLGFSTILLFKIYDATKTPTNLFLFVSLIPAMVNRFIFMFNDFGSINMGYARKSLNVMMNVMFLCVSLAVIAEQVIVEKNKEVQEFNKKLTRQLKVSTVLSEKLSISAEELSSSAEEVSASSENIASTQQQISKGSANQVMTINTTQNKFEDLNNAIQTIRGKVGEISAISDLITNIAKQTNMLALNAAIEAARAGEAGRGFNVVADQVRKLAGESSKAALKTDNMLKEIEIITKAQERHTVDILRSMDELATVAEETSASTEESAAAAEEQAASMESITAATQELLNLSQILLDPSKFNDAEL